MTAYEYLGNKTGDLPQTEKIAKEIFSLPMYPSFSDYDQKLVIIALHEILSIIDSTGNRSH